MAYTILLLPVTIARFIAFSGRDVPFRATVFADFVFNLQGVVNVALLLATRRFVPDTDTLPLFEKRRRVSMTSPEAFGITPFVLPPLELGDAEKGNTVAGNADRQGHMNVCGGDTVAVAKKSGLGNAGAAGPFALSRTISATSTSTTDSRTPLVR